MHNITSVNKIVWAAKNTHYSVGPTTYQIATVVSGVSIKLL